MTVPAGWGLISATLRRDWLLRRVVVNTLVGKVGMTLDSGVLEGYLRLHIMGPSDV
ncbi:hypothetical protein DPMN_044232 [Dreissena polymorpha]|uniref:Uncharacterized protein n=1 Tax=Dreissena polymorpha TaxID=45954 RepID=A0A9D4D3S2_DREPO|nr:hypothetical protein DPMN_044232 [Dreissena polymorpha]